MVGALTGAGCAGASAGERPPQAYYQTAYPSHDTSEELTALWSSVKWVLVSGGYHTYVFDEADAPNASGPLDEGALSRATRTTPRYRGRAATAVVLSIQGRNGLLLTADHAVHFPDTVVEHFEHGEPGSGSGTAPRRVRSVSVLAHRSNGVRLGGLLEPFQVLARDPDQDLALIGVRIPSALDRDSISPMPLPAGRSDRLSWGSFVYTIGFPSGYPMVTRGIVSDPDRGRGDGFLTDGLWNEGMSGGAVLAVRGRGGSLEWVGMARASAGTIEYRLGVSEEVEESHDPWRPYTGPIFVQELQRIQYGITLSVPLAPVRSFLAEHRTELERKGYSVPALRP